MTLDRKGESNGRCPTFRDRASLSIALYTPSDDRPGCAPDHREKCEELSGAAYRRGPRVSRKRQDQSLVSVPFGIHLKLEKKGEHFHVQLHPHPTTREPVALTEIEPFTVVLDDGVKRTTAMVPEQARKTIEEPEIAARLANIFLQATDNLEGKRINPHEAGARLVDFTIGFGFPRLNLKIARIEIVSLDEENAPLIERGKLSEMLDKGNWELRITANTALPRLEFDGDLFLFGLDGIEMLKPLAVRGLKRGEVLVVGFRTGQGYVRLGTKTAPIAHPQEVARAYIEYHFIGGVIGQQIAELGRRLASKSYQTAGHRGWAEP